MIKWHLRMEENGETVWADLYDNYQHAYDTMENSFNIEKKKGYNEASIDEFHANIQSTLRNVEWTIIKVTC